MILSLFFFLSSWVFLGFSLGLDGGVADSMPCVKKLLPCQPYLKASSSPPASCCVPLKEMVSDDTQCLCGIFDNSEILKSFNITQDDALKLPKACGANADISLCKNATAPNGSPTTPSTPANGSSSTNSTQPSAANGISQFGGAGSICFLVALVISAF
ncbi:hypothetical protein L1049_027767 [Liquidambar formosana]|uniref:Bifunctional inhibitor/plant lipid transfer protein/seed storage helical domain-containing protein n=1 Tax=Liquidambar formosana TaxID=63359 RepID=A0AAP0RLH6_LIQFO